MVGGKGWFCMQKRMVMAEKAILFVTFQGETCTSITVITEIAGKYGVVLESPAIMREIVAMN